MTEQLTYCNPLPLPNYQRGLLSVNKIDRGWTTEKRRDFREMADPTVIRYKGRWYLFPSCGQLWHSDDMVNWTYQPIEPFTPGYAPTVVVKGDWLYMTACSDKMWRARQPEGPWEDLGNIKDENGKPFWWNDPMLFVDDDGAMYCYHGLGKDGIYVAKMKESDPASFDGPRHHCFAFDPDHIWERSGEWNQNPNVSYIEGSWMTKRNGRYYLQYSGPGTEYKCYSLGCYVGESPLGPWCYQDLNPILRHKGGLVNGCAHHSLVEGPDGNLWCFYTTLVRITYWFERRIGMDPVGFNENGDMFVAGPSEKPQLAPGIRAKPAEGNDAPMLPLTVNQWSTASSYIEGREPFYAVDDNIRTWWQAAGTGPEWLQVDLGCDANVKAARIIFGDAGLDYAAGVVPGPYKYLIEGSKDGQKWKTLLDKSLNDVDRHIDYVTFPEKNIKYIRLTVLSAPKGMKISIWEFTAFGNVPVVKE